MQKSVTCSAKGTTRVSKRQAERCVAAGGVGSPPAPTSARPVNQRQQSPGLRQKGQSCRDSGGGASTAGQHPRAGTRCRVASVRPGATRGLLWQEEELLAQHAGVTIYRESQTHVSLTTLQPLLHWDFQQINIIPVTTLPLAAARMPEALLAALLRQQFS